MATHDEETRRFFKNSSVQVLLTPRIAGKRHSWLKQKVKFPYFIMFNDPFVFPASLTSFMSWFYLVSPFGRFKLPRKGRILAL